MTDIVGSTEHASELGDSAWRELVEAHHGLVRAALRRHGGREIDTAGDGFFATFDAPGAAVQSALEIVERVRALGIEVRAGLHVGEVEQVGAKVAGIAVPIASRIMAVAGPSEVLVSATVRDLTAGSGLRFADRGEHQLKGVADSWRILAVQRAETAEDTPGSARGARERRAAVVRSARSRPIWQRRPRLVSAAVIGLVIVVAGTGLLIWKPWQPPALASISENSIGIIDQARGELIGQIGVGTDPSGIALGEGFAWVTNAADDEVAQIDLATRSVVNRIPVGNEPTGISVTHGAVWVTNSGGRTVSRINAATRRVVQEIEVGNAPRAIVAAGDALWVANATDSTIVRVDSASGTPGAPIGVGPNPVALAADNTSLWVASEDLASVARVDPVSGATIATVPISVRPSALALGEDGLWVASPEGTLTRVDRNANRVAVSVSVGSALTSIALTGDSVWLGDQSGAVFRVDRANPALPPRRVATGASVGALAVIEGQGVWLATQQSQESHRGGTLRAMIPLAFGNPTDPLGDSFVASGMPVGDGLVGLRRTGGATGATVLANLATSIPVPTDGGLTYVFSLRPGILYSSGETVRPADFRRAIERSFLVPSSFGGTIWGAGLFGSISGADACMPTHVGDADQPVATCDLSDGISTDDVGNTVTFKLARPDPDFVYKLATVMAYPVPPSMPMDALVDGPFPVTGPYALSSVTETEIRVTRNAHFSVWDPAVRPDGFPDEIVFSFMDCPGADCSPAVSDAAVSAVENGNADVVQVALPVRPSADLLARLSVQYPERWHFGSARTFFVVMNTKMQPFDNVDVRRAVNLALDRSSLGAAATPSCQLLPPGWPGYQPYCPYTISPDAGGRWRGPDLERARQLVQASGTAGTKVTVGPTPPPFADKLDYLAALLTDLGYHVDSIDRETDFPHLFESAPSMHITVSGWIADYMAPGNFLQIFLCPEAGEPDADGITLYCDETGEYDAKFQRALDLQTTDRAAANAAWAELDHWAVDQAILAPVGNSGADLVSERVGNYQFSPIGLPLYDQMWVQ